MAKKRELVNFLRKTGLMRFANFIVNSRNTILKSIAKLRGKSDIDVIYSDKFFRENVKISGDNSKECVDVILEFFKPNSVVDFGCGPGVYLKEFEERGIKILGIDGSIYSKNNSVIDKAKIIIKDFRKEINLNKKFDMAICFEVAEHMEKKFSGMLVKNITQCGDIIIFTAAKIGQGGMDHINEQNPEFWINIFNENGFIFKKKISEEMKKRMREKNVVWWIPENLMVFKRINRKSQ